MLYPRPPWGGLFSTQTCRPGQRKGIPGPPQPLAGPHCTPAKYKCVLSLSEAARHSMRDLGFPALAVPPTCSVTPTRRSLAPRSPPHLTVWTSWATDLEGPSTLRHYDFSITGTGTLSVGVRTPAPHGDPLQTQLREEGPAFSQSPQRKEGSAALWTSVHRFPAKYRGQFQSVHFYLKKADFPCTHWALDDIREPLLISPAMTCNNTVSH